MSSTAGRRRRGPCSRSPTIQAPAQPPTSALLFACCLQAASEASDTDGLNLAGLLLRSSTLMAQDLE